MLYFYFFLNSGEFPLLRTYMLYNTALKVQGFASLTQIPFPAPLKPFPQTFPCTNKVQSLAKVQEKKPIASSPCTLGSSHWTHRNPLMVPPWVVVEPLVRGKTEKPKWVSMRHETTLVGVGIGHSEAQVLKQIWCPTSIWKHWQSLWFSAVRGGRSLLSVPTKGPGSAWARVKEGGSLLLHVFDHLAVGHL